MATDILVEQLSALSKALEAGNYNTAPSTLMQGPSLQVEDLSPVMYNTTFKDKAIKLQKSMKVEDCKSMLAQFNRQLSYGQFGGSAQIEGAVGQEETSDYVRVVVPMCFYSHLRRVTLQSTMVETVDGKKSDDRAAEDAAKKVAADIEFDSFRGKGDFSNAGVFDGNPLTLPADLPNILGLEAQIRASDVQSNAKDMMFGEFGNDESVVITGGGTLTQSMIEDSSLRSALNHGEADKLLVDPVVLSAYNKISQNKERIVLAGSPQEATGSDLRRQWTSNANVSIESSIFLRGKYKPAPSRTTAPGAPTHADADGGAGSPFLNAQKYYYYATTVNEFGESTGSVPVQFTITGNNKYVTITITPASVAAAKYFNVYRSTNNGAASTCRFIGRVVNSGAATTDFIDLGNKLPGFVTGYLIQEDTFGMKELAPYSRLKLAVTDLSMPEAHFRFTTLAVYEPRKNSLIDSLIGSV